MQLQITRNLNLPSETGSSVSTPVSWARCFHDGSYLGLGVRRQSGVEAVVERDRGRRATANSCPMAVSNMDDLYKWMASMCKR